MESRERLWLIHDSFAKFVRTCSSNGWKPAKAPGDSRDHHNKIEILSILYLLCEVIGYLASISIVHFSAVNGHSEVGRGLRDSPLLSGSPLATFTWPFEDSRQCLRTFIECEGESPPLFEISQQERNFINSIFIVLILFITIAYSTVIGEITSISVESIIQPWMAIRRWAGACGIVLLHPPPLHGYSWLPYDL
jgi:hypothetical protein